jgi:hypothetical protein
MGLFSGKLSFPRATVALWRRLAWSEVRGPSAPSLAADGCPLSRERVLNSRPPYWAAILPLAASPAIRIVPISAAGVYLTTTAL